MSRRPPNPTADRAAQNQQALKTLVKVESNKSCADCKKNKHPRWASWNLGIFICIRCSGIHRGMGTHISRVKSVDLDSWTDEQLQSMVKWGNARANKYWEAKLASGHVPAEAKIENFIRTKYDSKRWVMEGGIPDPATLDVADDEEDDVPLNTVKEKAQQGRTNTVSTSSNAAPIRSPPPPQRLVQPHTQGIDLFGDEITERVPAQPHTTAPTTRSFQQHNDIPAVRAPKPAESLLGFDFFGGAQPNPPSRPSSAAAVTSSSGPSRPDLKQSILSLYSRSAAVAQPAAQTFPNHQAQPQSTQPQSNAYNLDDAFSSLSFTTPSAQSRAQATSQSASQLKGSAVTPSVSSQVTTGHFFDSRPIVPVTQSSTTSQPRAQSVKSRTSSFGNFASSISPVMTAPPITSRSHGLNDLLGFAGPSTHPISQNPAMQKTQGISNSPFNLSTSAQVPRMQAVTSPSLGLGNGSAAYNANPWGSSDFMTGNASSVTATKPQTNSNTMMSSADWGSSSQATKVTPSASQVVADEDFGGWESSTVTSPVTSNNQGKRPAILGGSDDLFSNVWE